jgi:hypothetical protein
VEEAVVTMALVAPKNTILLVVTGLNPVPEMVTKVPIGPLVGVRAEIVIGELMDSDCKRLADA